MGQWAWLATVHAWTQKEQAGGVYDNREACVIHIGLAGSTQSSPIVLRALRICQMAPQQANSMACSKGINFSPH